ncbi:MAG: putative toxin-antitoxin system toxin component, PIN family [Nanoarchaeota archaeon]
MIKVVLDTNVFVVGFIDLAQGIESAEVKILKNLLNKNNTILLSIPIEEQIMRVITRVKDKNFAGLIRHTIWSDFAAEFVDVDKNKRTIESFKNKVPRKDLGIFLTAFIGKADYLISNDREFLDSASKCQNEFKCISPNEFLNFLE